MRRSLQTCGVIIFTATLIGACGRINESSTCETLRQLKSYTETIAKSHDIPREIKEYDLIIKNIEKLDNSLPADPVNSIIFDDLDFMWSEANFFAISGELAKAASIKKEYIIKIIAERQGLRGRCHF